MLHLQGMLGKSVDDASQVVNRTCKGPAPNMPSARTHLLEAIGKHGFDTNGLQLPLVL